MASGRGIPARSGIHCTDRPDARGPRDDRVCVRRVGYAKHCVNRTTGKSGRWHTAGTWNIGGPGPHIVRWYVNGDQVARWKFRVVSEGD